MTIVNLVKWPCTS